MYVYIPPVIIIVIPSQTCRVDIPAFISIVCVLNQYSISMIWTTLLRVLPSEQVLSGSRRHQVLPEVLSVQMKPLIQKTNLVHPQRPTKRTYPKRLTAKRYTYMYMYACTCTCACIPNTIMYVYIIHAIVIVLLGPSNHFTKSEAADGEGRSP